MGPNELKNVRADGLVTGIYVIGLGQMVVTHPLVPVPLSGIVGEIARGFHEPFEGRGPAVSFARLRRRVRGP